MAVDLNEFTHPAWKAAVGTVVGYGLILVVLTLAMFALPWLIFATL
ncbi:hypothetical protein [Natrarchaeobaculum sulfurireducens]|nr:hypothetical protein [Natrarchaeobaculum sulfurireducens]